MIDFHSHTLISDGALIASELANRAKAVGYSGLAITDHADASNIEQVLEQTIAFCESFNDFDDEDAIKVIPGLELTHVPPKHIGALVEKSRALGAAVVLVHGETMVEPVPRGTNRAAIEAGVDILAHPGLITEEDTELASKNNVIFEITTRHGHSFTNGHVGSIAKKHAVELILNSDSHAPGDLITSEKALNVVLGAGMAESDYRRMEENARKLFDKVCN